MYGPRRNAYIYIPQKFIYAIYAQMSSDSPVSGGVNTPDRCKDQEQYSRRQQTGLSVRPLCVQTGAYTDLRHAY
jgi:hypothetical protein